LFAGVFTGQFFGAEEPDVLRAGIGLGVVEDFLEGESLPDGVADGFVGPGDFIGDFSDALERRAAVAGALES
jgi:hypothetical protein